MCLVLVLAVCLGPQESGAKGADLVKQAAEALQNGNKEEALRKLNDAVALDGRDRAALQLRARVLDAVEKFDAALADLDKLAELKAGPEIYDLRGSVHFKLGKFELSLLDFEKYLELRPREAPGHWRRGITCYYAGKFEAGAKQFEGYESVDTNDVENAVWHYLCNARALGIEQARQKLLKIGNDRRKPMMEVYALYAGKETPEGVLAAARAGNPGPDLLNRQLFYAHLYLGLYWEAQGDAKKARTHIEQAVEHRIDHYMWQVARVHRDVLRRSDKGKSTQ